MDPFATKLGLIFSVISIGMLLGGYISYRNTRRWLANTAEVTGKVVSFTSKRSIDTFNRDRNRSQTMYYPTVRYQTTDGQTVTFTSSVGSSSPAYQKGQDVPVRYNLDNRQDAEISAFVALWLVPLVLTSIGALALVAFFGLTFVDSAAYTYADGSWQKLPTHY
ncbi:DUF3592 domain-containing protein [Spirosoma fluminis]